MATKNESRDNMFGVVENWQTCKSVTECLRYSLDNKILCDVTFIVGEDRKRVEGHRLILSLRSSVFMSMMNGLMAESGDIIIPDIELAIFEEFLQFLYTDEVITNGNNVIGLLYTSRKYDIDTLEQQCMQFLDTSLTSDNACIVMEQAHLYNEYTLKKKSFEFICQNGDACLQSDAVIGLCAKCLDEIVQSEQLIVNEKTVFEAILTWSEVACRSLGREVTPENRRNLLGEIILHVRYPILSEDYFADRVLPTNLLTIDEGFKIMKHFLSPNKNVFPFNPKQRKASSSPVICVTRLDITKGDNWGCIGNADDRITFSINKDAQLVGFQLYGARNNTKQNYDITAFVTNTRTDQMMVGCSMATTVTAASEIYDILFPQSVRLRQHVRYCLNVNIKGPRTYSGLSGKSVVNTDTITCYFSTHNPSKHSNKPSNETDVRQGQIPSLLFQI